MDTQGPVSVLDSGRRHREALVTDRLTRRRCQDRGPGRLKAAHSELDVVYRIPQPYRTSFSAKHSVERLPGSDRSHSLSPASSLRSVQSSRSERVGGIRYHHHPHPRHGHRAKSPKRVTYDTRVTVRHSDADDSMFTELSSRELEESRHRSYGRSPASSSALHTPPASNHMSRDSGLDYSTQLRDLSDQIIKMDWSTSKDRGGALPPHAALQHSPPGILKESQNSHKPHPPPSLSSPTSTSVARPLPPQVGVRDKENAPNGSPPPPPPPAPQKSGGEGGPVPRSLDSSMSREYQHERVLSYREAVSDGYGPEVRALVEAAALEESSPSPVGSDGRENGSLLAQQRSSSVSAVSKASLSTPPSNQLTPAKRSVSTSIGNFFRRISPRLGRRPRGHGGSKDRSNNGSRAGSSQSLPATAGVSVMDPTTPSPSSQQSSTAATPSSSSSGHFSRSRIRNSFLKLMGGGRKDSKSKVTAAISSAPSPPPQGGDLDSSRESEVSSCEKNTAADSDGRPMPEWTQRRLKSMEQNHPGKKDVYKEFKDKRSPRSPTSATGSAATAEANAKLEERYRAIKAQYKDRPHPLDDEFSFDTYDSAGGASKPQPSPEGTGSSEGEERGGRGTGGGKAEPPSSLDVVPPRAIRLLQASTISTISGDESIGECSLDCNLTASQPSLLSGASHQSTGSSLSKKAVLNQSLLSTSTDSQQLPPDPTPPPADPAPRPRRQKDALVLGQELIDSSLSPGDKEYALSPLSPLSPCSTDPSRKPSYLKLSCAVSGYGKYSRYSSYKSIPTRSPFSSTSSLRSDLSSPDPTMPSSVRSPDDRRELGGGRSLGSSPIATPTVMAAAAADLSNGKSCLSPSAVNGHSSAAQKAGDYPTGDRVKDGQYFLDIMKSEEERLNQQAKRAEGLMRSQALPEEVNGRIRAAIGKSNLLISQKFKQFRELCDQHMDPDPDPEEQTLLFEDLQGFWALIKIQVDNVDDSFAEIVTMSQNGWKEIPKLVPSRRSSTSSSPKSGSLSQTSTPSATPGHTPGSRRRGLKANSNKDTPDSSPEHAEKMRSAAKARDEARKRMLAEKRAAMKQQQQQQQQPGTAPEVEIFLPDGTKK